MIMIPKEKALELVAKYRNIIMSFLSDRMKKENAKQCALIAVDEILKLPNIQYNNNNDESQYDYWEEVKTEINKL